MEELDLRTMWFKDSTAPEWFIELMCKDDGANLDNVIEDKINIVCDNPEDYIDYVCGDEDDEDDDENYSALIDMVLDDAKHIAQESIQYELNNITSEEDAREFLEDYSLEEE